MRPRTRSTATSCRRLHHNAYAVSTLPVPVTVTKLVCILLLVTPCTTLSKQRLVSGSVPPILYLPQMPFYLACLSPMHIQHNIYIFPKQDTTSYFKDSPLMPLGIIDPKIIYSGNFIRNVVDTFTENSSA